MAKMIQRVKGFRAESPTAMGDLIPELKRDAIKYKVSALYFQKSATIADE
jgi:hypothetical protein